MSAYDLILIAFVAAGAFYAGYLTGRGSAASGAGRDEASPLPGPGDIADDTPLPGPSSTIPSRRSSAPPPASAGGGGASASAGSARPAGPSGTPQRRSGAPPPAAAGLADKSGGKSD